MTHLIKILFWKLSLIISWWLSCDLKVNYSLIFALLFFLSVPITFYLYLTSSCAVVQLYYFSWCTCSRWLWVSFVLEFVYSFCCRLCWYYLAFVIRFFKCALKFVFICLLSAYHLRLCFYVLMYICNKKTLAVKGHHALRPRLWLRCQNEDKVYNYSYPLFHL